MRSERRAFLFGVLLICVGLVGAVYVHFTHR